MQLNLGTKIRELRLRGSRTQETLADALGVSAQAVSRWESGGSYPDMEIIPSIANYFGVTIDELFGYDNNRDNKVIAIVERINSFGIKSRSDDDWVDECLSILREGLSEFPNNELLSITLADTLSEAGWRRYKEWLYYDDEGYIQHNHNIHRSNEYWIESIKLCEYLVDNAKDNTIITKALHILVLLYRNLGENVKAISYAKKMPQLRNCQEIMLISATDGKEQAKYIGEFLLKAASEFSSQLISALIACRQNFDSDMPINKIKGAISIFELVCDDENMGIYNGNIIELYLYLSRVQWERGYHDEAFISLDKALKYARDLETLYGEKEHNLTAPLVRFVKQNVNVQKDIVKSLPDDWPMWCSPDYSQVEKEIKADSRWHKWVMKTQEQ